MFASSAPLFVNVAVVDSNVQLHIHHVLSYLHPSLQSSIKKCIQQQNLIRQFFQSESAVLSVPILSVRKKGRIKKTNLWMLFRTTNKRYFAFDRQSTPVSTLFGISLFPELLPQVFVSARLWQLLLSCTIRISCFSYLHVIQLSQNNKKRQVITRRQSLLPYSEHNTTLATERCVYSTLKTPKIQFELTALLSFQTHYLILMDATLFLVHVAWYKAEISV